MSDRKGIPSIAAEYCKGCGLCVSVCPESVLAANGTGVNSKGYRPVSVKAVDSCIACLSCALMCPDSAITVERLTSQKER